MELPNMDRAKNYRLSMKPMHKGPLRQSMALEKSLLEPIYDDEALAEFALSDPAVRYNKWATCCISLSAQDICFDETCKAFCGWSIKGSFMQAANFCFSSKLTLGSLPPSTKPIVHAETSTLHGKVRVTRDHVIIDRVEGMQNHTVVIPMTAIQEMRVEDAAQDLHACNIHFFCGKKAHCCRLTHPAHRLKLYGQPMKKHSNLCCYECRPQLIENGVASIPTDDAEELCEIIAAQMKEVGKVPDGNAFLALKVEDQFGKLFGRGTVTVVSKNGRAVQFSEKNKIKSPTELDHLSKKQLIDFLKLNGSPHDYKDQRYDEILDAATALWGSIRSFPYQEFASPIPQDSCFKACETCYKCLNCDCTFIEIVVPKLETERRPAVENWSKMENEILGESALGLMANGYLQMRKKIVEAMTDVLGDYLDIFKVCPVKITFLSKNEPPQHVYKPTMKKDMVAEVKSSNVVKDVKSFNAVKKEQVKLSLKAQSNEI